MAFDVLFLFGMLFGVLFLVEEVDDRANERDADHTDQDPQPRVGIDPFADGNEFVVGRQFHNVGVFYETGACTVVVQGDFQIFVYRVTAYGIVVAIINRITVKIIIIC